VSLRHAAWTAVWFIVPSLGALAVVAPFNGPYTAAAAVLAAAGLLLVGLALTPQEDNR
jgi:hypothetical protein